MSSEPGNCNRQQIKATHKLQATASLGVSGQTFSHNCPQKYVGRLRFDLSKDYEGEAKSFAGLMAQSVLRALALQGNPVDINLDFVQPKIND